VPQGTPGALAQESKVDEGRQDRVEAESEHHGQNGDLVLALSRKNREA